MNIKNKIKILLLTSLSLGFLGLPFSTKAAPAPSNNQIAISAYIVNNDKSTIKNGQYTVRFALYSTDRTNIDPYPSNSDAGQRVWEETQTLNVNEGLITAYLGSVKPFPAALTFSNNSYYLGIQINQDSEMAPRKKIGSVPVAIDSTYLQGKSVGNQAGDIPVLTAGGGLDTAILQSINEVGTIANGIWQGTQIADNYLASDLTGKTYNGINLTSSNGNHNLTLAVDATLDQNLSTLSDVTFAKLNLTNALTAVSGGTGFASYEVGDMLYAISKTELTKLSIGSNDQMLAIVNGIPTWKTVNLEDSLLGVLPFANGGTGNTTFATGSIIFSDGAKFTENNGNFFWDNVTQRLGLGTNAPATALEVVGTITATGGTSTTWNTAYANRVDGWNAPLTYDSNQVGLNINNANLRLTSSALDTAQDINQTSSPQFAGLTLTGNLTLGGNTLTTSNGNVVTNLNADKADGFHFDQSLLTTATPIFAGLTVDSLSGVLKASGGLVSGSATTSDLPEGTRLYYTDARARGAVFAGSGSGLAYDAGSGVFSIDGTHVTPTLTEQANWNTAYNSRVSTWSQPLTFSSNMAGLSINGTNLQITSGALNTKQDIDQTASPQFAGLTLTGNLTLGSNILITSSSTVVVNLNADMADSFHFDQSLLTTATPSFRSLTLTGGDLTLGNHTLTTSNINVVTNLNADMVDGYQLNQPLLSTSSPSFVGLTVGALNGVLKASNGSVSGSATTADLPENFNLYYTDARARAAISSNARGLSYDSNTGFFSLTAGYVLPTTTEQTNWTTAYTNRVDVWSPPLAFSVSNKTASLSFNNANFKLDGGTTLNTTQDIAITSSPQFAGLTLTAPLSPSSGGTGIGGLTPFAVGDLLYASSTTALSRRAVGSNQQVLSVMAGVPQWTTLSLSAGVADTLPVINGGTGNTSFSAGSVVFSNGSILTQNNAKLFWDNNLFRLGIGTTSPVAPLDVVGNANVSGTLSANSINATSLTISGQAALGTTGQNVTFNSDLLPGSTGLNLGAATYGKHWANLYVDNISVGGTDLNGTSSQYFAINTGALNETTMGLRFNRGETAGGYATLVWDSSAQAFVLYKKESAPSVLGDLTVGSFTAQTNALAVTSAGKVGVGTTTPSALFSVGSSSPFQVDNAGNVSGTKFNGNTITGTGTLNLGTANSLIVSGNASLNQPLLSTSSPSFAGLTVDSLSGVLKASGGLVSGSATTSNLPEGTNFYYTDARAHLAVSLSSATGLLYNNNTGAFSLDADYAIPLNTTQATWNTAYTNRVDTWSPPLAFSASSKTASLSFNNANFKLDGGTTLNTTQDIAITSSPQFAGLTLTGFNGVLKTALGVVSGLATTSNLPEGTNFYYTDARARLAVSLSSATGLLYNSGTGAFSLDANYSIPLITNQATWTTAYNRSVDVWNQPLTFSSNGASLSINDTNLQITAGALNTKQNIAITSSPQFAGLTLASPLAVASGGTGASTFNANYLLKGNGSSAVAVSSLIYDNNMSVGIGTSSPLARLHVLQSGTPASTATSYGALIENQVINGSADGFRKYGLFVSSTGNWAGDGADNYGLYVDVPTGGSTNTIAAFAGSSGNISMPGTGYELQFSRPGINYLTASNAAGSLVLRTGGGINNRLSIDSSGNFNVNAGQLYVQQSTGSIGIGTTSPSSMLTIFGANNAFKLAYDGSNYTTLQTNSSGELQMLSSSVYDASLTLGSNDANNVAVIFDNNSNANDFYAGVDSDDSGKFKIGLLGNDSYLTITNSGDVGIGLASPAHKLDILQTGSAAGLAGLNVLNAGSNSTTAYGIISSVTGTSPTNVGGYFSATGSATNNYGLIVANGNVGIGTTNPATPLDVNGTITISNSIGQINFGTGATLGALTKNSFYTSSSSFIFQSWNGSATQTNMAINSTTGNVGIGTTAPLSKLHLVGNMMVDSGYRIGTNNGSADSFRANIQFGNPSVDNEWLIFRQSSNPRGVYVSAAGTANPATYVAESRFGVDMKAVFGANVAVGSGYINNAPPTDGAIIQGNVGIGTTSPTGQLELYTSSVLDSNLRIRRADTSGNAMVKLVTGTTADWIFGERNNGNSDFNLYNFGTNTDVLTVLRSNGNVGIGTTSPSYKLDVAGDLRITGTPYRTGGDIAWQTPSDSRLKNVVGNADKGLTELMKLSEIKYTYIADNPFGLVPNQAHTGLIAQDVQQVFPEAVTQDRGYLTLNTTPIFWAMLKGIQELNTKNNLFVTSASGQFDALGDSLHITNSSGNSISFGSREFGALRNRELTLSADTLNLDGNVNIAGTLTVAGTDLLGKINENSNSIVSLTDNQTKLAQQITGQLADQSLSIADKLTIIGTSLDNLNAEQATKQLKTLKEQLEANSNEIVNLKSQFTLLQQQASAISQLLSVSEGVVDLKEGILKAKGVTAETITANSALFKGEIVAGVLTIKAIDQETKTVGQATICQLGNAFDEATKQCLPCPAEQTCDGKSVLVKTKAVSANSRIFLTPAEDLQGSSAYVTNLLEGQSFTLKISQPIDKNVLLNWWIVEEK